MTKNFDVFLCVCVCVCDKRIFIFNTSDLILLKKYSNIESLIAINKLIIGLKKKETVTTDYLEGR